MKTVVGQVVLALVFLGLGLAGWLDGRPLGASCRRHS